MKLKDLLIRAALAVVIFVLGMAVLLCLQVMGLATPPAP
jgi:hypothetical protein